ASLADWPLGGASVVDAGGRGPLLRLGPSRLREELSPTAGSAVALDADDAEGARVRYQQVAADEWSVTVRLPALVADVVTARALQDAIVARLLGEPSTPPAVEPCLKYMNWQRMLVERAPRPVPVEGPADARLLVARTTTGPATPEWVTRDLSPAAVASAHALAARHGVDVDAVLLAAWRLLAEAYTGTPGLPLAVAVDGRHPPVPADLLGHATPWRVWAGDRAGALAGTATAAGRWLRHAAGGPAWPPTVRPGIGFAASPAERRVTRAGLDVVVAVPVPEPVGATLTLVAGIGADTGQLGLWFDDSRVFGDDALAMLAAVESVLCGTDPGHPVAEAPERTPERFWDRISAHARRTPDAMALTDGVAHVTYADLLRRVDTVAAHLHRAGVRPDSRVGILATESPRTVLAMLGVLRCGGAYVPLNPALPGRRLAGMVRQAGVELLLTGDDVDHQEVPGRRLALADVEQPGVPAAPADPATGDDLAYVLFTSGSTGAPKGVMVTRAGLDSYLDFAAATYLRAGGDVVSFTSAAFDLTVTSMLAPLAAGRTVRLVAPHRPLDETASALASGDVAMLKLTPSHLTLLTRLLPAGTRVGAVVVGGEELTVDVAEAWRDRHPECAIFNEYGPTETVVGCTVWRYDGSERGLSGVPIGHPLPGVRIHVLDEHLRPVPDLAAGQIAIGGVGVARGYAGAPRETAQRFVPDPFGPPGSRMYLSGDVGVRSAGHGLRYAGRRDGQISLHGFRIEPGEVEAALRAAGATDAAVRLTTVAGDAALAAYVVTGDAEHGRLRSRLAELLPDYMLPRHVVRLPALPLTVNGKVDDAALRRLPLVDAPVPAGGPDGPATPGEAAVRAVWAEVLQLPEPPLDVRFFDLGGTSFALVKVVTQLQEVFGREIAVATMFEHPTIRAMAAHLSGPAAPAPGGADRAARRRAGTEELRRRRETRR
ncbi:amino acid adenylation domain-containing protein, partial [Micromonospora sp. URMC 107]|uniref:non-ribosomal peptide synthetase n=1 Tax=Micromonospora sp. URMC 107 TaxID=3423418 RepID=UPI003F1DB8FA